MRRYLFVCAVLSLMIQWPHKEASASVSEVHKDTIVSVKIPQEWRRCMTGFDCELVSYGCGNFSVNQKYAAEARAMVGKIPNGSVKGELCAGKYNTIVPACYDKQCVAMPPVE